jgi:linoleoyl-CoA desaturase
MGIQAKPKYSRGNGELIFKYLRKDAQQIVANMEPKKRFEIRFKAILFPLLYLIAWLSAITLGNTPWIYYACFIAMGLLLVIIYLNVIHDAVHHTIFKSRRLNEAFVYIFDLIGANSFIWKNRHIRFHHNYPNVMAGIPILSKVI